MNRRTTSEIQSTHDERPTRRIPRPHRDRTIHDRQPTKHEQEDGSDAGSFCESSDGEYAGDYGEHALVDAE
jgi:hypothetical protein